MVTEEALVGSNDFNFGYNSNFFLCIFGQSETCYATKQGLNLQFKETSKARKVVSSNNFLYLFPFEYEITKTVRNEASSLG